MSNLKRSDQFIAGKFVPSVSGEYFPLISPETEQVTAEVANSTAQDVDDAVQAAHRAFKSSGWRTQVELRIATLRTLAAKLRQNMPAIVEAEARVTGRPIREMRAQLEDFRSGMTTLPALRKHWKTLCRRSGVGI